MSQGKSFPSPMKVHTSINYIYTIHQESWLTVRNEIFSEYWFNREKIANLQKLTGLGSLRDLQESYSGYSWHEVTNFVLLRYEISNGITLLCIFPQNWDCHSLPAMTFRNVSTWDMLIVAAVGTTRSLVSRAFLWVIPSISHGCRQTKTVIILIIFSKMN